MLAGPGPHAAAYGQLGNAAIKSTTRTMRTIVPKGISLPPKFERVRLAAKLCAGNRKPRSNPGPSSDLGAEKPRVSSTVSLCKP